MVATGCATLMVATGARTRGVPARIHRNVAVGVGVGAMAIPKFQALAAILPRLAGQRNSSATFSGLRKAALADEDGKALNDAIQDLEEKVKT